jgi:autophagy-related protein 2
MVFVELSNGKLSEVRLWNVSMEYHIRLLKLFEMEEQDVERKEDEEEEDEEDKTPRPESQRTSRVNTSLDDSTSTIRKQEIKFPIYLIDCAIGLTPFDMPSKAQLIIRDATSEVKQSSDGEISAEVFIRKAALCLIDDVQYLEGTGKEHHSKLGRSARHHSSLDQVNFFLKQGYVPVASISSILCKLHLTDEEKESKIKLELSSELLVLETCPDSTQTLIQLINELKPPIEGGEEIKYHTEVLPVNLLEDIDERAFNDPERPVIAETDLANVDFVSDDLPSNLDFVESYYADKASKSTWNNSPSVSLSTPGEYSKADLLLDQDLSILAQRSTSGTVKDGSVVQPNDSSQRKFAVFEQRAHSHESMLDIAEDHFSRTHSDILVDSGTSSGHSVYDDDGVMINSGGEQSSAERSPPRTTHGRKQLIPKVRVEVDKVKRITWNLHDGYDWTHTQDTINNAVDRVETRATEAHKRAVDENFKVSEEEDGHDSVVIQSNEDLDASPNTKTEPQVIGDLLFNSIYIGIPNGQDPTNLRREINKEINDEASEATSVAGATTVTTGADSISRSPRRRYSNSTTHSRESQAKKLKLKRSRYHKVKIELYDFAADTMIYAGVNDREKTTTGIVAGEEGELLNRVDMRIRDLEIIDNVPTSTWNKFVTYMRSSGDRESDASMVHIIMDNVKPIADVATSEAILNVFVLPLRLHVDQDTLDFLTRFFEFKDERFLENGGKEEEIVFIQKVDIRSIKVKLDYKPKKVDYRGLKSGHITEFMNFFILDEAEMVLRRTVLYGVPGIARLTQMLHSIWMPDIRTTQLGDVLAGIAPVRSLLRLGSGVKDLVVVPVREYRKDGRIIRSLQKGAWTFARNTTNEMVKFGAKLAAGTQTILESAEQAMGGTGSAGRNSQEEESSTHPRRRHISAYSDDIDDEDLAESYYIENPHETDNEDNQGGKKAVSLYANQPTGVTQGLQVAYTSLGRNFALAKEAVSDIGTQTADRGGNAQDAARAVVKAAPIALIRPVIGATEAVSKTLLGVTNQIDPNQMQNVEDVSYYCC